MRKFLHRSHSETLRVSPPFSVRCCHGYCRNEVHEQLVERDIAQSCSPDILCRPPAPPLLLGPFSSTPMKFQQPSTQNEGAFPEKGMTDNRDKNYPSSVDNPPVRQVRADAHQPATIWLDDEDNLDAEEALSFNKTPFAFSEVAAEVKDGKLKAEEEGGPKPLTASGKDAIRSSLSGDTSTEKSNSNETQPQSVVSQEKELVKKFGPQFKVVVREVTNRGASSQYKTGAAMSTEGTTTARHHQQPKYQASLTFRQCGFFVEVGRSVAAKSEIAEQNVLTQAARSNIIFIHPKMEHQKNINFRDPHTVALVEMKNLIDVLRGHCMTLCRTLKFSVRPAVNRGFIQKTPRHVSSPMPSVHAQPVKSSNPWGPPRSTTEGKNAAQTGMVDVSEDVWCCKVHCRDDWKTPSNLGVVHESTAPSPNEALNAAFREMHARYTKEMETETLKELLLEGIRLVKHTQMKVGVTDVFVYKENTDQNSFLSRNHNAKMFGTSSVPWRDAGRFNRGGTATVSLAVEDREGNVSFIHSHDKNGKQQAYIKAGEELIEHEWHRSAFESTEIMLLLDLARTRSKRGGVGTVGNFHNVAGTVFIPKRENALGQTTVRNAQTTVLDSRPLMTRLRWGVDRFAIELMELNGRVGPLPERLFDRGIYSPFQYRHALDALVHRFDDDAVLKLEMEAKTEPVKGGGLKSAYVATIRYLGQDAIGRGAGGSYLAELDALVGALRFFISSFPVIAREVFFPSIFCSVQLLNEAVTAHKEWNLLQNYHGKWSPYSVLAATTVHLLGVHYTTKYADVGLDGTMINVGVQPAGKAPPLPNQPLSLKCAMVFVNDGIVAERELGTRTAAMAGEAWRCCCLEAMEDNFPSQYRQACSVPDYNPNVDRLCKGAKYQRLPREKRLRYFTTLRDAVEAFGEEDYGWKDCHIDLRPRSNNWEAEMTAVVNGQRKIIALSQPFPNAKTARRAVIFAVGKQYYPEETKIFAKIRSSGGDFTGLSDSFINGDADAEQTTSSPTPPPPTPPELERDSKESSAAAPPICKPEVAKESVPAKPAPLYDNTTSLTSQLLELIAKKRRDYALQQPRTLSALLSNKHSSRPPPKEILRFSIDLFQQDELMTDIMTPYSPRYKVRIVSKLDEGGDQQQQPEIPIYERVGNVGEGAIQLLLSVLRATAKLYKGEDEFDAIWEDFLGRSTLPHCESVPLLAAHLLTCVLGWQVEPKTELFNAKVWSATIQLLNRDPLPLARGAANSKKDCIKHAWLALLKMNFLSVLRHYSQRIPEMQVMADMILQTAVQSHCDVGTLNVGGRSKIVERKTDIVDAQQVTPSEYLKICFERDFPLYNARFELVPIQDLGGYACKIHKQRRGTAEMVLIGQGSGRTREQAVHIASIGALEKVFEDDLTSMIVRNPKFCDVPK